MLASTSNQISSFPFLNQTLPEKSINGENPTSTLELLHSPPSLLLTADCNPFLDDDFIFSHILYSQQQQLLGAFTPQLELQCAKATTEETTIDEAEKAPCQKKISINTVGSSNQPTSRKRSAKDRHSKICTSKGPRDRRMRLSLEIARSFFDLQDMLGFDKASKTVEWLFSKSRSAIKELKEKYSAEVMCNYSDDTKSTDSTIDLIKNRPVFDEIPRERERKRRQLRVVDKESRYKARARARERTREKLIHRLETSKQDSEANPADAFQTGREGIRFGTLEMDSLLEVKVGGVDEPGSQLLEYQTDTNSHGANANILGKKGESAASLIHSHCENEVVSSETCSDQVRFPGSPMDLSTVALESMKQSPAGLKMLELDEIDHVLIFYAD